MDWSYAAGLFDGEGSISLAMDARSKANTCLPCLAITQSEKYRGFRAIHELALLMESEGINTYVGVVDHRGRATVQGGSYKRNYRTIRMIIRGYDNVLRALRKLLPYFVIRKNSAEDMIRFLTLFPPRTGKNSKRYRPKRIAGLRIEPTNAPERTRGQQVL